jgi:hypothetical protein
MTDQADLERRIAELERRLADAKAADGADAPFTVDAPRRPGRIRAPDETARGDGRVWIFFGLVFVLPIAAVVCLCVTTALVTLAPSTAMWMSGIVCGAGYDLANDNRHYGTPSGGSGTTMSFRCVSGQNSYHASDFAVFGLQFLLVGVVLCAAVAVGVLMWRLAPKRATQRRRRHPARVALIAAIVPMLAPVGIIGYLLSRPSPPTSKAPSASATTTAPPVLPTPTPAGPVHITYSVTGVKAPGDSITITYVDAAGRQRTQRDADIPWTLTLALTPTSAVRSVQASSLLGVSQLNCAITTSDGKVAGSSNHNGPRVSC